MPCSVSNTRQWTSTETCNVVLCLEWIYGQGTGHLISCSVWNARQRTEYRTITLCSVWNMDWGQGTGHVVLCSFGMWDSWGSTEIRLSWAFYSWHCNTWNPLLCFFVPHYWAFYWHTLHPVLYLSLPQQWALYWHIWTTQIVFSPQALYGVDEAPFSRGSEEQRAFRCLAGRVVDLT